MLWVAAGTWWYSIFFSSVLDAIKHYLESIRSAPILLSGLVLKSLGMIC